MNDSARLLAACKNGINSTKQTELFVKIDGKQFIYREFIYQSIHSILSFYLGGLKRSNITSDASGINFVPTRPKITDLLKLMDHQDPIELKPTEKTYLEGWKHALLAIKGKKIFSP